MKRRSWISCLILLFGFALFGLAGVAKADPISLFDDAEKNIQAMQEAVLTSYFQLGDLYGTAMGNPLDISDGTFSAAGFSFSLTGTYQGMAVDESFVGSYDAGTESGSYTSSGTVGTDGVIGDGSWSWVDASATEEDLTFASETESLQSQIKYDTETQPLMPKLYFLVGEDPYYQYVVDQGIVAETKEGNLTGRYLYQYSQEIWPKFPPPPPPPPPPPDSGVVDAQLGSDVLTASYDFTTDTATGRVSTVPEPATWMLVATGLVGMGLGGWTRGRTSTSSSAS